MTWLRRCTCVDPSSAPTPLIRAPAPQHALHSSPPPLLLLPLTQERTASFEALQGRAGELEEALEAAKKELAVATEALEAQKGATAAALADAQVRAEDRVGRVTTSATDPRVCPPLFSVVYYPGVRCCPRRRCAAAGRCPPGSTRCFCRARRSSCGGRSAGGRAPGCRSREVGCCLRARRRARCLGWLTGAAHSCDGAGCCRCSVGRSSAANRRRCPRGCGCDVKACCRRCGIADETASSRSRVAHD
jgi:hypothetical protein